MKFSNETPIQIRNPADFEHLDLSLFLRSEDLQIRLVFGEIPLWRFPKPHVTGAHLRLSPPNFFEKVMRINFSLCFLGFALFPLAQAVPQTPAAKEAMPDLVVSDIQLTETENQIGDESHLLVRVRNIGTAPTKRGDTVGVAFSVDGTRVAWSDTFRYTIPAGGFAILRSNSGPDRKGTWKVASGTHTLRAVVDDASRIAESNENNNSAEVILTK